MHHFGGHRPEVHRKSANRFALTVLLAAMLNSDISVPAQPGGSSRRSLVLKGGTIYPSPTEEPIQNGTIVIQEGRIAAAGAEGKVPVPKGAELIDCSGLTITAGFWNSHVHFARQRWADAERQKEGDLGRQIEEMLTRYGFTSVFDLGSPLKNTQQIRKRIESGEVPGPRIRSTGDMVLGKGFSPSEELMRASGMMRYTPEPEVSTAGEALAASRKRLDAGADGLKFYASSAFAPFGLLSDEVIHAIVAESHRRNKPTFAHPQSLEGLLAAVRGGVDVIAHTTPKTGAWDPSVVKLMRDARIALIPTLKVWTVLLRDRPAQRDEWTKNCVDQLRTWSAAGGVVLFDTDIDAGMEDYDPRDEYGLMNQAGMTYRQILASLTTAPATRFEGARRVGRIAIGFAADLVVLAGDPSRDVKAFGLVRYTIRSGKVIYRSPR